MKKIAISMFLLMFMFFVVGCGSKDEAQTENDKDVAMTEELETKVNEAQEEEQNQEKQMTQEEEITDKTKVKNLMSEGKEMECRFEQEADGQKTVITMMFGGHKKFKSETEVQGMKIYVLSDSENIYTWSDNPVIPALMISHTCFEEMQEKLPAEMQSQLEAMDQSPEEILEEAGMNVSCKVASGLDLEVPDDKEFMDQCAMLKQIMDSGFEVPSIPGM